MAEEPTGKALLPRIPNTLALLFGAELLLTLFVGAAAVSQAARGRPSGPLMALPAILFVCALSSFPVVVGRGLGAWLRRIVAAAVMIASLGVALAALLQAASLDEDIRERGLKLDREIEALDFDIAYPAGPPGGRDLRVDREIRANLAAEKGRLEEDRSQVLVSTGVVLAVCTLMLVLNALVAVESTRLMEALSERRRRAPP